MSEIIDSGTAVGTGRYLLNAASTFVWRMSKLAVGLGAVVATLLYFKQNSLLYFPEIGGVPRRPGQNPRRYRSPSEHGIPFESLKIKCSDGVSIHAWLLLRDQSSSEHLPTLVFFHGNAGNIGLRLPNALQMLQYLNANVLMVEYRGYGDSDSVAPTEAGLKLDAEAALRFIVKHPHIDAANVFLFGRSLGGAVAFHLAQYAQREHLPLAGVIVENTFTSIADMVDHLMPMIAPLKALVLRIDWNSLKIAPTLTVPILFLAGARDQLVPHEHMLKLYKATRGAKIHVVKDGTHNETWTQGGQEYWEAIKGFLADSASLNSLSSTNNSKNRFGSNVGDGANAAASIRSSSSSAIPIMPNNILNLAQESMRGNSSTVRVPDKKQV